ncbi:MAG: hypothetical protein ACKUBY_03625 [Candidatus Moraniibacteriota bacterium]|jgi:hypothetical protein
MKQEVIDRRRAELVKAGLSIKSIEAMSKHTKSLCGCDKIEVRFDNLYKLGFDAKALVEANVTILNRKSDYVVKRFSVIKTWFVSLDKNVDVHLLFMNRIQLWSMSSNKLITLQLLSRHLKGDITPERLCTFFTCSLENILLMYIEGFNDFMKLRNEVRYRVEHDRLRMSIELKRNIIKKRYKKLPKDVFEYYNKHFL